MAWRFVLAGVLIMAAAAGTTAVAGLLQVKDLADALSIQRPIQSDQIQLPSPGKPQTILIIGSDHRAGEPFRDSNTDTIPRHRERIRPTGVDDQRALDPA